MPQVVKFEHFLESLKPSPKMPMVFLGHGNPIYAITDNRFAKNWRTLGDLLPRPQAILCISAHWETNGTTLVHVGKQPKTIHDFYGFPQALFDVEYPAIGAPDTAREVARLLKDHNSHETEEWGLDHGAWAVLRSLFPNADVPVFQLSIDMSLPLQSQYELASNLAQLREKGVLIIGSGNVVHNLRKIPRDGQVQDWAQEFDQLVETQLVDGDHAPLFDMSDKQSLFQMAHPTWEHYSPMLYIAANAKADDQLTFFNEELDLGALSMRSFVYF
ncbi:4,5-DOPA dioxygenase extradiol [Maritalea sp.]|uniref:4,5-DOPA-extradiol-dioxygenase n=1 Tax=Maritalea sp. TaxID=2003361 RepID=UPI003EF246DE